MVPMQEMNDTARLLAEIEAAFPPADMPAEAALVYHSSGCSQCDELRREIEEYRGKPVTPSLFRQLYQELRCLSPESTRWILPYFLKYCLTPEATYDGKEITFLVYSLAPSAEYREQEVYRLSLLDKSQIVTFIHFLEWCSQHDFWKQFFPEDIENALFFVRSIETALR